FRKLAIGASAQDMLFAGATLAVICDGALLHFPGLPVTSAIGEERRFLTLHGMVAGTLLTFLNLHGGGEAAIGVGHHDGSGGFLNGGAGLPGILHFALHKL